MAHSLSHDLTITHQPVLLVRCSITALPSLRSRAVNDRASPFKAGDPVQQDRSTKPAVEAASLQSG